MVVNPLSQLRRVLFLAFMVMVVGVVGYRLTAQLSWLDALYMTVITLSTVGYREVMPDIDGDAKLFTIVLILGGAGVLAYSIKTVTEVLLDDATKHFFHQRSTLKRLEKMKNHYIVCGLGRVGKAVCEELLSEEVPFVIVERNQDMVRMAQERGWNVVEGDATEDRVLEMRRLRRQQLVAHHDRPSHVQRSRHLRTGFQGHERSQVSKSRCQQRLFPFFASGSSYDAGSYSTSSDGVAGSCSGGVQLRFDHRRGGGSRHKRSGGSNFGGVQFPGSIRVGDPLDYSRRQNDSAQSPGQHKVMCPGHSRRPGHP